MKKLNKFVAVLVALAMMAALCITSAFAADTNAQAGGTPTDPKNATLTKTLSMPDGVTQNDPRTFTFKFAADENNPKATTIEDKEITPAVKTDANNDEGTLFGKAENVLTGVAWEAPGVYEFTVTEDIPAGAETADKTYRNPVDPEANPVVYKTTITEKYDYSNAEYKMLVGVASYDDNGTTKYYVESVSVIQTRTQDGTAIDAEDQEKVNITNPTGNEANGFVFENKYNKTVENTPQGTTPDGPGTIDDESLFIEKTIENTDATTPTDEQKAKEFRMNVTVAFPTNGTKTAYTAKRVDANGTQVGTDYTFDATHLTQVVPLKYGERLVFTDIEYGASWTVTEDAYPAYTATYTTTNEGLVKDTADNKTVVKNTYDKEKDPATGLSIANMPFIVLALVAIGGLVAYVIVRRRDEDNA